MGVSSGFFEERFSVMEAKKYASKYISNWHTEINYSY